MAKRKEEKKILNLERLKQFIEEGRLIRKAWTGTDAEGRETACLLAALSEDVAKAESASACPAELMPSWLAHLTPWIDDAGSDEAWPDVIRKYADLASRWHVLTPEAWERTKHRVYRVSLLEAMSHTKDEKVLKVCNDVLSLLNRAISGDMPREKEWLAAAWAAEAVEAAWAAAAEAAVWAARAAAAEAAVWAAWEAAAAAVWAAAKAEEAEAWVARAAAADRIIAGIFEVLEDEISWRSNGCSKTETVS